MNSKLFVNTLKITLATLFFLSSNIELASAQRVMWIRKMGISGMKFLGKEILKQTVTVGINKITQPKQEAPTPTVLNKNSTATIPGNSQSGSSKVTYVGSFYQCSVGCKYYWSQQTGWQVFNSNNNSWRQIEKPSRLVVRTHNVYFADGGFFQSETRQDYGYSPEFSRWVYF